MIKAYINQIAYELDADYSISEQAANKIASNIVINVDNQPLPQSGDIIEIKDDATTYFLGTCGIPKSPQFSSPADIKRYSITCSNANAILSRRAVNVAFKGWTITQIVEELFNRYIAAEGFTLGEISTVPIVLNKYTAADYGLQFCLDELAEYVQGSWRCTNDRKFYFLAKDDFPAFPKVIEGDFVPITDLQVTIKDTDLRTSQIISGGTSRTQEQSESFVYSTEVADDSGNDRDPNSFPVSFGLAEKPTILVNNVVVPSNIVGVRGINDSDNRYMFLFAYNSAIVTYNPYYTGTAPAPLVDNDSIEIYYYGLFPIRAIVQNQNAINEIAKKTGTSGVIDNVKIDKNIKDIEDAVQYGSTLLANHGKVRTELKGWISMRHAKTMGLIFADFDLLKKWTFNLPQYGAVGEYVLVERSMSPFTYESGTDNLKVTLKLVDRAYLKSYGQVFDELSKVTSQMSIRENDVIVDIDATDETLEYTETQTTAEGEIDTEPFETVNMTEAISSMGGGIDTEPLEIAEFAETHATTEGEIDTDKAESLAVVENAVIEQHTDFMVLYCTSEAQFMADGQIASPTGLLLYAFSSANGG